MEEWSLVDAWQIRNPQQRTYTFRRGTYSSRLDYFLTSPQLADSSCKANAVPLTCSDHSLVTIQFKCDSNLEQGPGFWRFNTDLLTDPSFITEMSEFLWGWSPPQELSSPSLVWEWLKHEIRSFVRQFSRKNKNEDVVQWDRVLPPELQPLIRFLQPRKRSEAGMSTFPIPIHTGRGDLGCQNRSNPSITGLELRDSTLK